VEEERISLGKERGVERKTDGGKRKGKVGRET
jgi:hypothetical protein